MDDKLLPIDVGLPTAPHRGGFYKYPWDDMKVGDSFLVSDKTISTMSSVANRAAARLGFKFSCRSTADGVRVWRVS